MPAELTSSQRQILEFLQSRVKSGETPPTYRDICKRFGYSSPKAASDHVAALERKGYLTREKGRARSLHVVEPESGIPLLGHIAAGYPNESSANLEKRLRIDPTAFGIRDSAKAFALRVAGDSMVGKHIFDGDIVLLEKGLTPRKGDIVAALIDNESTLKTIVRRDGGTWLQAENPLYPTLIPVLGLTIQGVARGVIRFLSI